MRLRIYYLLLPALCLAFPILAGWGHWGPKVKIGLSLDHARGREVFIQKLKDEMEDEHAELVVSDAWDDPVTQEEQVKDLIGKGIQALVLLPCDPLKAAPLVKAAHDAGIQVVGLESLIPNSGMDYLVAFDQQKAGKLQVQAMLKKVPKGHYLLVEGDPADPYLSAVWMGQREVLKDPMADGDIQLTQIAKKNTESSEKFIKTYLDGKNHLDVILAPNDELAFGASELVEKAGLSGKVFIAGIGENAEACQRIFSGTQTLTLYDSPAKLAEETAYLTAKVARKATQFDCQFTEMNDGLSITKAVLLTPQVVDAKNLDSTVIQDGVERKEFIENK